MGSPTYEVFFLFNPTTGVPLIGQAGMTFSAYKDHLGGNILPQPSIVEIGGGAYGFQPTFVDPNKGIVYVLNTNGGNPLYVTRYMRPEDWNTDNVDELSSDLMTQLTQLRRLQEGRWKIHTSGPDANKLVLYSNDGVTPLQKWELYDSGGIPTDTNFYERVPTTVIP